MAFRRTKDKMCNKSNFRSSKNRCGGCYVPPMKCVCSWSDSCGSSCGNWGGSCGSSCGNWGGSCGPTCGGWGSCHKHNHCRPFCRVKKSCCKPFMCVGICLGICHCCKKGC